MGNMFDAANDNRKDANPKNKEIEVNDILGSDIPKNNMFNTISKSKKRRNISIDQDLDNLYASICFLTNTTVSEVIQEILIDALDNNKDIVELAEYNKEVQKLINDYKRA